MARKLTVKTRFGVVPNKILNDPSLSFRAKGIFAYLQSKPEGWKFSVERIANDGLEGREAIRKAIHELEEAGYLQRRIIKENGKLMGYEYILTDDCPSEKKPQIPSPRIPSDGAPGDGAPGDGALDDLVKKISKKDSKKDVDKNENIYSGQKTKFPTEEEIRNFFDNIDKQPFFKDWVEIFPEVDIRYEAKVAKQWLLANPHRRKSRLKAFFLNWVKKASALTRKRGGGNVRFVHNPGDYEIVDYEV